MGTVEINEYPQEQDKLCVWPLEKRNCNELLLQKSSQLEPTIQLTNTVFDYLENHVLQKSDGDKDTTQIGNGERPIFHMKRKFEYHFRLVSLHVIMVHFSCTFKGTTSLHLGEVYHIKNGILRATMEMLFDKLGTFSNYVFGASNRTKLKRK